MIVARLSRGPRRPLVTVAVALVVAVASTPALAERHVALLVGVADYGAEPMNLTSPPVDVAVLGEALEGDADFDEVIRVEDPDRSGFVATASADYRRSWERIILINEKIRTLWSPCGRWWWRG